MLYKNFLSSPELAQILGHLNTQSLYEVYVSYVDMNSTDREEGNQRIILKSDIINIKMKNNL